MTVQISSVLLVGNTSFGCTAKIIIKVNDNDGGRVVMQARTVTAGLSVCVSTVSFIGRAVCVAGVRLRCT